MTTVARKSSIYTVIGKVTAGGTTTLDQGGSQVLDDAGETQLQDPQGNTIYVSAEDFAANWQVVAP